MPRIIVCLASLFLIWSSCKRDTEAPASLTSTLDSLFTAAHGQGFHGSVLVLEQDSVILEKGYGYANQAAGLAFAPDVFVQIGSNVKDFTKTAIYQLIERGRLKLDDTLGQYIPDLRAPTRGITILQLLEHRSGLPMGLETDDYPLTSHEMISRVQQLKLINTPGTVENYSNLGYSLLAYIIGLVSNVDYDHYVAQNILSPLGMVHTGSFLPGFDTTQIAHGYRKSVDQGIILNLPHDGQGHLWSLKGNGGYLSTLQDMHRFYHGIKSTDLVKDEAYSQHIFPWTEMTVLAGSDLVNSFIFAHYPGLGIDIYLASNHAEFSANKLLPDIERFLGVGGPRIRTETDTDTLNKDWPPGAAGQMIVDYLQAYQSGDTTQMHQFFLKHAEQGPEAPSISERVQRYQQMFDNLGALDYLGYRRDPQDPAWQIKVKTAQGDLALMTFITTTQEPPRLQGIKVMVGE